MACDPATQDPIDLAILAAAGQRRLLAEMPRRVEFVPFDPSRRYSLGRYENQSGELCVVKGAPRAVGALIANAPDVAAAVERLAGGGNRVLAVASGRNRDSLQLVGLVALEDPPRPDAASLVKGLQDLGVRVVMITGDNLATARTIAQRVGIGNRAATAAELEKLDGTRALDFDVYARVFPEHKIELVRRLQGAGHIVGMTGDGVNDAPALKQADIGIAVASATDVARAAAGVVLTSPGLVDAISAVQISRRIYQRMLTYSLNKIIKTLEIAVFLTLGVMLTGAFVITPLLIVLLLFTNDFVTMSIATDRVSFSPQPDRWSVKTLMLVGAMLALLSAGPLLCGVLRRPQLAWATAGPASDAGFRHVGSDRTRQRVPHSRTRPFLAVSTKLLVDREFDHRSRCRSRHGKARDLDGSSEFGRDRRIADRYHRLSASSRSAQGHDFPTVRDPLMHLRADRTVSLLFSSVEVLQAPPTCVSRLSANWVASTIRIG